MTSPVDDLGWLLLEPFNRTEEQVAKLTDKQIWGLYNRERDEKTGALKPVGVENKRGFLSPESQRTEFIDFMVKLGTPLDKAEAAWEKGRTKG